MTSFNDGKSAIECVRAHESEFDVMILDLCMPEMDGYQVAETIRYGWRGALRCVVSCCGAELAPARKK